MYWQIILFLDVNVDFIYIQYIVCQYSSITSLHRIYQAKKIGGLYFQGLIIQSGNFDNFVGISVKGILTPFWLSEILKPSRRWGENPIIPFTQTSNLGARRGVGAYGAYRSSPIHIPFSNLNCRGTAWNF